MTEQFVTNPSGLKYLDLQPGSGAIARPGQQAEVHYTGWLTTWVRLCVIRGGSAGCVAAP
jgi:hypothetical protein